MFNLRDKCITLLKIQSHAENNVCLIEWTWSPKICIYFYKVILSSLVMVGPTETHDKAALIIADPPSYLTVEWGHSQSYACASVLQAFTRLFIGKYVNDNVKDHIIFYPPGFVSFTKLVINVWDKWLRNCCSAINVLFMMVPSNCNL
ncbi:hypothetical protein TNCV_374261 [Trichonephila clavipes]|nr:hypothetical protein TNCV_374261 [Trichonephila clavipes]